MSDATRSLARRPTSKRANQVLCVLFIIAGLGLASWGGWSLAGATGPRSTTAAKVVDLTYSAGGYHTGPSWLVEVAWDGGSGTMESHDLYDALYPLEGQPPVVVERSVVTGAVLRAELGGQWYSAPESSVAQGAALSILGLAWAAFFIVYLVRVVPRAPEIRPTAHARRLAPLVLGAIWAAFGLWLLASGGLELASLAAPRTATNAVVVDAAYNYVDLALDRGTMRLISSDLARDIGIRQSIDTTFGRAEELTVVVERSAVTGSVLRARFDDQWYDTGPSLLDPVAQCIAGLIFLGTIVLVVLVGRRRRVALRPAPGASGPATG